MKKNKLLAIALVTAIILTGCSSKNSKNDDNVIKPKNGDSFISLKKKEKEKKDNIIKQIEKVKEENSTKPQLEIDSNTNEIKAINKGDKKSKNRKDNKANVNKEIMAIKEIKRDKKMTSSTKKKRGGIFSIFSPKKNEIKSVGYGKIVVKDKKGKTVSVIEDEGPNKKNRGKE